MARRARRFRRGVGSIRQDLTMSIRRLLRVLAASPRLAPVMSKSPRKVTAFRRPSFAGRVMASEEQGQTSRVGCADSFAAPCVAKAESCRRHRVPWRSVMDPDPDGPSPVPALLRWRACPCSRSSQDRGARGVSAEGASKPCDRIALKRADPLRQFSDRPCGLSFQARALHPQEARAVADRDPCVSLRAGLPPQAGAVRWAPHRRPEAPLHPLQRRAPFLANHSQLH